MRDLLKKIFDLWVETNWIRTIKSAEKRLERLQNSAKIQELVLDRLRKEFLKRYPLDAGDGN